MDDYDAQDDEPLLLDPEYTAEIRRRIREIDSGRAKMVTLEEIMTKLRQSKATLELPTGWCRASERARHLEAELASELPPGHPLFGKSVQAFLVSLASDDVLFDVLDEHGKVAEVHLTWSRQPEVLPWPSTIVFDSLAEWVQSKSSNQIEGT